MRRRRQRRSDAAGRRSARGVAAGAAGGPWSAAGFAAGAARDPVYTRMVPGNGLGVFAARNLSRGEKVLGFQGPWLRADQVRDFTHCLEIGNGAFLGPSGGADDFVNHGCNPNCGVFFEDGAPVLRVIRPILAHRELTFDYSTVMLTDPTTFECRCGSRRCRGVVGDFFSLPLQTRARYLRLGIVPFFVTVRASAGPGDDACPAQTPEAGG